MKVIQMTIKNWMAILCVTNALTLGCFAQYDAIHQAALDGNLDEVKILLKANPKLVFNKVSTNDTYYARYGYTPLLCAAEKGHKDVVEYLLANRADIKATFANGWTALHLAAYHGRKGVVELLLIQKAKVNAKGLDGNTPLHLAAMGAGIQHKEIAEMLLASKARIDARDAGGNTPLHNGALLGRVKIVRLLLDHKAEVAAKNKKGERPLDLALRNGREDAAELLRQQGNSK